MDAPIPETAEEGLDPADWESFRSLAHRALDRIIDYQRDVGEHPAWQPVPEHIEERFGRGRPLAGAPLESVLTDFEEMVLPYPTGLQSPRWWGWAGGNGTPTGMLADMLAAGMNAVPGNFNDGAARVEDEVLSWMKEAMGFPSDAGGIMVSGGSVANLVGVAVGRDVAAGYEVRRQGVGSEAGPLVLYTSREVHSSVFKAARLLGLGTEAVRLIDVDRDLSVRVDRMAAAIEEDGERGQRPFAIVGTAGTINTGAIDDLEALADLAQREGLWFHVDGAFGAMARLSPATRHMVKGIERADSLAFDFHKWMNVNYEAACVLVRDADALRASFAGGADYLKPLPRGTGSNPDMAGGRGPQLSRAFKALKVWMMLKEHGFEKLGRMVWQNVRQARHLRRLMDASDVLDVVAPVTLNVVAFRVRTPGAASKVADEVNRELLMRVQESGVAIPSSTMLDGRVTLRACLVNHRTRVADLDLFVETAEEMARDVLREMGVAGAA